MSNYNSELQSNNTDLQAILNTINGLPNAGGSDPVLQDKTITPTTSKQTITADNGYDGLDTVTVNAMPTATQATPTITVNSSTGLITATATQNAGYVAAGTKSATMQLAFQAAQTITPGTTNKTIAANTYLGGVQTIKGDANLVAGNIKNGTSIFGVTGTYEGSGGGDTSTEELITRTITSYTNSKITSIGSYAFYNCTKLTTIDFPEVKSIGGNTFYSCSNLTTISFPKVTSIGAEAFYGCSKLTTASFPSATTIYPSAFAYCSNLTTISFPKVTKIENCAFIGCSKLTTASFPSISVIMNEVFRNCIGLTTASFPSATDISFSAFAYCSNLTTISFPKVTVIRSKAFQQCINLTTISFQKIANIENYAFQGCYNLISLYLTGSSVCQLSNSYAFTLTPIGGYSTSAGRYGSIFVPASLLASYKAATNWTYFSSRFVGI